MPQRVEIRSVHPLYANDVYCIFPLISTKFINSPYFPKIHNFPYFRSINFFGLIYVFCFPLFWSWCTKAYASCFTRHVGLLDAPSWNKKSKGVMAHGHNYKIVADCFLFIGGGLGNLRAFWDRGTYSKHCLVKVCEVIVYSYTQRRPVRALGDA